MKNLVVNYCPFCGEKAPSWLKDYHANGYMVHCKECDHVNDIYEVGKGLDDEE